MAQPSFFDVGSGLARYLPAPPAAPAMVAPMALGGPVPTSETAPSSPSFFGGLLDGFENAVANPLTLGGMSLLSGGDANSGIRAGLALQQNAQAKKARDAVQTGIMGLPNLSDSDKTILSNNPELASTVLSNIYKNRFDPMAGLDADYKRAQIGHLKAQTANEGSTYGKTGFPFQGSDGRFYTVQFGSGGQRKILPLELPAQEGAATPGAPGGAPISLTPARGVGVSGDIMYDKATGGTVRNVGPNLSQGKMAEGLGSEGAKYVMGKPREDANAALSTIHNMQEARAMLQNPIITGAGANLFLNARNWAKTLGIGGKDNAELVANTQAFAAQMGREVGNVIRAFGSGTGLSDADRQYAQAIAGGDITLTKQALMRITEINEKLARAKIKVYNDMVARTRPGIAPFPLEITPPPEMEPNPAAGGQGGGTQPPQGAQTADIDPRTVPAGQTFTFRGHTLRALGNGQFEQVQ